MNAKKAKSLRKSINGAAHVAPVISFHERLMPVPHMVVNPIRYPAGSARRLYQDSKRAA